MKTEVTRITALRRVRLPAKISAVIAVGLLAGWLGMLYGGHAKTDIGPADVTFSLRPSLSGGTVIEIPPLGTLHLDSHAGPVRIDAQVTQIHPEPARKLIEDPSAVSHLTSTVGADIRHGFIVMIARAVLVGLACAAVAGFLVFRSWKRCLWSVVAAFNGMLLVGAVGALTFNPQSVAEPRFTGILVGAPQVVGDAKSIVSRFGAYRAQLAQLIGNVSRLYDVTSTLPTYEPDPTTIRVLHVSDIHLNPVAWSVIQQVTKQFSVQMVIDTGDLTDHGSSAEEKFANDISKLKVPYVFIRGNHDSADTEKSVRRQKNAVVLDNQVKDVGGLRIFGIGDPRFTPDKTTRGDDVDAREMLAIGHGAAAQMVASRDAPDVVLVHDPAEGQAFDGTAPLVLSGHMHQRSTRLLASGTRLFIQGSTGGAGMRGLEHEEPTPFEMSVLYFNRTSHRLQGWDDIRLGGLGLTSAQIERTLEHDPDRPIGPLPPVTPTPSVTATPSSSNAGRPG
ncbi:metallophosphoesterase [Actinomadura sp. DC4]|uniref:metallophosphoesterase family protein n=1 Tax=Actinomadura sp. DC4 TaxID=3055069 RepID=UPI0025B21E6F|nr:metallophosphoesterase [Actinomadura sp. DC4]MDN3360050.1 metallophosphoesterase [Actinomadura sp. DC4]